MQFYQKLVQEDLNVGTGTLWISGPGGGELLSTQVGLHSVARNQVSATATWDPGAVAAGSKASTTVTVTDAAVGDFVMVSHDKILTNDLRILGHVRVAGTVEVVLHNPTAASITVPSGTVSVLVFQAKATSAIPAPIAYYSCEEASGNILDQIGTRHLTPFGSPAYQATGKNGYGVELSANETFYNWTAGFPNSAAHSISIWCRFSGTTSAVTGIAGTTFGTPVIAIGRQATSFGIYYATGLQAGASGRTPDTYYHLVYTYDGGTVHKLYVNGDLDVTYSGPGVAASITDFFMSSYTGASTHIVDEAAWFNRCLGQQPITNLYSDGDGTFWPWS